MDKLCIIAPREQQARSPRTFTSAQTCHSRLLRMSCSMTLRDIRSWATRRTGPRPQIPSRRGLSLSPPRGASAPHLFRRQPDQDQAGSRAIRVLTSPRGQPPHRPCPVRRAVDPGCPSGVLELRAGKIGRPTAVRTFFEGRGEYWPYETPGLSPLCIAHQHLRSLFGLMHKAATKRRWKK